MLAGKITRLRRVIPSDLDKYLQWLNNPEIARLIIGTVIPLSPGYVRNLLDDSYILSYTEFFFTIETLNDRKIVGFCLLKNLHPIHRLAELEQFFIGEETYRRNGYGRDALQTLLRYTFSELNLNRIWLITYAYNQEAISFYEKEGFIQEGILRELQFTMGRYYDGVLMAILKEDWERNFNQTNKLLPKGQTQCPPL